jgi:hypothetical protein
MLLSLRCTRLRSSDQNGIPSLRNFLSIKNCQFGKYDLGGQLIKFIRTKLISCGVGDVNLPSFPQERSGFLDTDRWSDPDR